MKRNYFLTTSSVIAFIVGVFALVFPKQLLESKGGVSNLSTLVWTREVGVLLIAIGFIVFSVRDQKDSPMLKAIFLANVIIQLALFLIELLAFRNGIITKLAGVLPNLSLHVLLATGFGYYYVMMKAKKDFVVS